MPTFNRFLGRFVRGLAAAATFAAAFALAPAPAEAHSSAALPNHSYGDSALGKIVVGIAYDGTPFAYKRDGEPRGFEVDLAEAVAAEMNVGVTIRWMARAELVPALAKGEVDLINAAAAPGPLPDAVDTVRTLDTGVHLVVRRDNPFAIHSAEDLSGTMVIATMATPGEAFAADLRRVASANGRATVDIHTMPLSQYTPVAVLFGHASGYFAPTAAVALLGGDPMSKVKPVPGLFRKTGALGFGFLAARAELKRDLRLALAQVVIKGTYKKLLAAYHIPADCSPFR